MGAKPMPHASPRRTCALVVSCEHASNRVPPALTSLFQGRQELLASHRGWDLGAIEAAWMLGRRFKVPVFAGQWSRLCVDLNRSASHPKLFEEKVLALSAEERAQLIARYHVPYRFAVEQAILRLLKDHRRVLHISVHSFTPVFDGELRNAEVGLLYDPRRSWEERLCRGWKDDFKAKLPDCRVRRNYPYVGTSDGFTTYLRGRFAAQRYAGIELELNQAWSTDPKLATEVMTFFGDMLAAEL